VLAQVMPATTGSVVFAGIGAEAKSIWAAVSPAPPIQMRTVKLSAVELLVLQINNEEMTAEVVAQV
jgi:hypothetical protein